MVAVNTRELQNAGARTSVWLLYYATNLFVKGAIVINIISVYLISTTVARATLIAAGVWYTYGRESTVGGIVVLG